MIRVAEKKNCCGCGACAQKCPKRCIRMAADDEGFLYPEVDLDSCVSCGICEKVCPVLNFRPGEDTVKGAYAAYAKDTPLRMKSSSGGMFSVFAKVILDNGGVVFGAAFDEDFSVHHISAEDEEGLAPIRKSKYTQSRTEDTFISVKEYLQAGRWVLYTGTGCQISGLKRFLGAEYENLYTIDVLCEGVPSPNVWRRYLERQEKRFGAPVVRVDFRGKKEDSGWSKFETKLEFANSKKYSCNNAEDPFMQTFLNAVCLRPSCYACKFKGLGRDSDISIGDCWGIEKRMPDMDDDRGTSIVLVHSDKGQALLNVTKEMLVVRPDDVDKILPPYYSSRRSMMKNPHRDRFMREFHAGAGMDRLAEMSKPTFGDVFKRKVISTWILVRRILTRKRAP